MAPAPVDLINNPLLLTDGTVIVFQDETTSVWKLTPDAFGSYVNGTWSQIAPLPSGYEPFAFASAVLPDGRVIVEGGECNSAVISCGTNSVWTSLGAIYDPIANTWTSVSPPSGPGWVNTDPPGSCNGGIGDAASIVLPSGKFMLSASCAYPNVDALFHATTLTWTSTEAPPIPYLQGEQGYTLLQNGKVLTIDVGDPPNAWAYDPGTGTWSSIAPTPVPLTNPPSCGIYEIGPAVTRPDGTVVAFGGIIKCIGPTPPDPTAIYSPSSNTWIQGPNIPSINGTYYSLADAPAAQLPNGNILFAASPGFGTPPVHFFEFTGANAINQVADDVYNSSVQTAEFVNFLLLPTGQVLATDLSRYVEIYTPTGSPNPARLPTVTSVASCVTPGSSYLLSGIQLNGLSQGAAYGDDWQAATNYPLVQIVNNSTGHVFYARTSGHSTMSIAPGQVGSTNFKVATNTETGASTLYVVANGVRSVGTLLRVSATCPASHDFNADGKSDILFRNSDNGATVGWLMDGSTITQSATIATVPTSWQIVGQRDFNGDGKADLLWRNTTSGAVALWLMNGLSVSQSLSVATVPTHWVIAGVSDFNGDGKADILWRDSATGAVAIWLMNGATVLQTGTVGTVASSWVIAGTGPNGQIFWRNATSGALALWDMNGFTVSQTHNLGAVANTWDVVGSGDFDGNGSRDLLFRNSSTGAVAIWFLTNGVVTSSASLGTVAAAWSIDLTGDFDGNGKSDILWTNTNGARAIWFMNGASVASTASLGPVATTWGIQSMGAE